MQSKAAMASTKTGQVVWRQRFLLLIGAGVILRATALAFFGPYQLHSSDPYNYLQLAQSLDRGDGLVVDDRVYGPGLRAFFPPFYPLLLGAFGKLFGLSGFALMLSNTLLDSCTAYILRRHDIRAAAIFFLWPWNILGSFIAQKESLICLLVVALADIAVRKKKDLDPPSAASFGVCSAALVLTQPALAAFPITLSVLFFYSSPQRWQLAIIAACVGLVFLLPWWVRNWMLWRTFVPLTTSGGVSLAVVVNEGHYPPPAQFQHLAEPARFAEVGSLARRHLVEHPLRYLLDVEAQVSDAAFQEKFALSRVSAHPPSGWQTAALAAFNWVLVVLAAFGRSKDAWRLLLAAVLSLLPCVWLEFGERHRYFLLPFVALLAAEGTRTISRLIKDWRPAPRCFK